MLIYPEINPIAFKMGPVAVHWYGLMYIIGFALAWTLALVRAAKPKSGWTSEQVADLIFYSALGVILGGRLGYFLFYDFHDVIHHPFEIFKIWEGGMAFHGGVLGVTIALWFFHRKTKKSFAGITDFLVPLIPLGLAAGRIGNFINGELWGRVTEVPWAMIFPQGGPYTRHPSQLYEFLLEGVALFIILWWYSAKPRPRFAVSALFLLCYGSFRFFAEFFRQPDIQWGFIRWDWLTMGQLLSIPMILIGLIGLIIAYQKNNYNQPLKSKRKRSV
jgi:phosphatidylglycerol:prolipoprotein diacylglycerol transferase